MALTQFADAPEPNWAELPSAAPPSSIRFASGVQEQAAVSWSVTPSERWKRTVVLSGSMPLLDGVEVTRKPRGGVLLAGATTVENVTPLPAGAVHSTVTCTTFDRCQVACVWTPLAQLTL